MPRRHQAFDVQGEQELADALGALGVRVVKRSPEMTVTLVSDYLEEQLSEVNKGHLSSGAPWVLAQPTGIFPLVGPVFRPGKGPCWMCLADRMVRNREVRALLDGSDARCLSVSPLVRHTIGQSGIQLAANEIAKAIATGFRTDLSQHIVELRSAWARPSRSTTWRRVRNARFAARTICTIPPAPPYRWN